MGIKRALWSGLRKYLTIVNANFRIIPFLILCTIFLTGFAFGEIPDLEILPPVCGAPSSNCVVFYQTGKDYFEVLDAKTNTIKRVNIPFDRNKMSPLSSYDDYVFFQTEKYSYRFDIIKNIFQEFPRIHNAVYFNYNTNILVRNLYNFEPNTVHFQKEKYDPEKKTFAILKTWPKYEQSWYQFGRDFFIIINQARSFFVDLDSGLEKTLKGKMNWCIKNNKQVFLETNAPYEGKHLYQIDLAFRGRTIDYAIVANSEIFKEFSTGWYRRIGVNKKTGCLYSAFTNRGNNSLELITLENGKFVKKIYTLPKELPYKFIYEKEKNNFMEGSFYTMYDDLAVFYFNMDNNICDTRFIFLDTKKYDQLPENDRKDSIVFEFKNEFRLHQIYFYNDKFYIGTDTRLYFYDYDYNLLWKKLCPKYFGEVKYGNSTFSCYSIFNNDTLLFDVYAKEYDENGNFKHNYYISPCLGFENTKEYCNFIPTKHGIFSIYCDTEGIQLARIRLFKPDVYAPAYDLTSKNKIKWYRSWKYDGEDLIILEDSKSGQKITEVFNIKLGQFVE